MKGYPITENDLSVNQLFGSDFSGNVIPHIWWKKILFKNDKPAYTAINILADLLYWYKPFEVRDEDTGQSLGFRKKFKGDALQRSYSQFEEIYGFSKKQIRTAGDILEELGLVKRDPRTIHNNGVTSSNVMFWLIDVEKIKELTYTMLPCKSIAIAPQVNTPLPTGQYVYREYTENTNIISEQPPLVEIEEIEEEKSDKYTLEECLFYHGKPNNEKIINDTHATAWILCYIMNEDTQLTFRRYLRFAKDLQKYKHTRTDRTADLIFELYNNNAEFWLDTYYGSKGWLPNEGTIRKTIKEGYEYHKDKTI